MERKKQTLGALYLLGAALVWGFGFVAQDLGAQHVQGFTFQAPGGGLPAQGALQVELPLQHVLLAEGQPIFELAGGLEVHLPCDLPEALALLTLTDPGVHL